MPNQCVFFQAIPNRSHVLAGTQGRKVLQEIFFKCKDQSKHLFFYILKCHSLVLCSYFLPKLTHVQNVKYNRAFRSSSLPYTHNFVFSFLFIHNLSKSYTCAAPSLTAGTAHYLKGRTDSAQLPLPFPGNITYYSSISRITS